MAKLSLTDVSNILTAATTINTNNAATEAALENTLSRDGTTPNEMNSNLDMNAYRVYNLGEPVENNDAVRKADIDGLLNQIDGPFYPPDKATQSEAEVGTENTHWMTPLRTAQAIAVKSGSATSVLNRTALAALDTATFKAAVITNEGGRNGLFYWSSSNLSTQVTSDPQQGVYVAPATATTGASGAWVRVRDDQTTNVEWFGAVAGGVAASNYTAIMANITFAKAEAGGTILVPNSYVVSAEILVDGNDLNFKGTSRGASGFSRSSAGRVLQITGSRHSFADMLIFNNSYTTTVTDYVVWVNDAVQLYMDACWIQGGYHCLAITGSACADNTFTKLTLTYAMGTAMVYMVDAGDGVNGANHFYRCTFNQGYPVSTPNGTTTFKGARANSTAYSIGDIVIIGSYYYQCLFAGTTAGSAPSTVGFWYGQGITDNSVGWLLVGHTAYCGIDFSSNTYYNVVRECDFTGPYQHTIRIRNEFSGSGADDPNDILISRCTLHGPINTGVYRQAGSNILLDQLDMWNGLDNTATTYGILSNGGAGMRVTNCTIYGFDVGSQNSVGNFTILGGEITGCGTAVKVESGLFTFSIQGVLMGSSSLGGANTNSVVIASGCNYFQVVNNLTVGSAAGVSDSSGGANKTVSGNH